MTMRAVVERASYALDPWGLPGLPTWNSHIASLACYSWANTGKEIIDGDKTAVMTDRRMIVPLGTDIVEDDRITDVEDRLGVSIFPHLMRIEAVLRREDHIELTIEDVE